MYIPYTNPYKGYYDERYANTSMLCGPVLSEQMYLARALNVVLDRGDLMPLTMCSSLLTDTRRITLKKKARSRGERLITYLERG